MALPAVKEGPSVAPSRLASALRSRWPWALAVAVVLAVGGTLLRARGPRVPTTLATRRDLEQHLVATGRVLPPARVEVAALAVGLVREVRVREGDPVVVDELLVQLDDAEAKASVLLAEAAVAQAAARADRASHVDGLVAVQALAQAGANLTGAQVKFDRTRQLFDKGSLTRAEFDEATRALRVARAVKETATLQLSGSGVDAQEARAGLQQAQAQLVSARVRLSQTRLVALADGYVLARDAEPGAVVQPARTLLVLSSSGDARLVLQPDERDLALLRLGLQARASADAYPGDTFAAEVTYLSPLVDATRGTLELHLRVREPPAYLRADMTVSVDVAVATRRQALVVRSEALRGLATATPWVLVVEGDRAVRRGVRVGIRGEALVEVVAGLAEGEAVVVPDGQVLAPGQRVRPMPPEP